MVVKSLLLDGMGVPPVFRSMKLPVPKVHLTIPGVVHICPKSAACWSPATPEIGIPAREPEAVAHTPLDGTTSGRSSRGIPKIASSCSSH